MREADTPEERARRLRDGIAMQVIEGNPLTDEEVALFERFEREGWSAERRLAYLKAMFANTAEATPAE